MRALYAGGNITDAWPTQAIEGEGRLVAVSDPGKPSSYGAGEKRVIARFVERA